MAKCNRNLVNVCLVGFGFLFIFSAFQALGNILETIIDSIKNDNESFQGDGYVSLSIVYTFFAISNWTAPSAISIIGPKFTMFLGGLMYLVFELSFLLPRTWLLYLVSVLLGFGAALLWTGQGNYLTLNSTQSTISRNSGLFWAILQLSMFVGNTFVYFEFQGKETIEKKTRNLLFWAASGITGLGLLVILILPKSLKLIDSISEFTEFSEDYNQGPLNALKGAFKLLFTRDMLLLCVTFFYTGIELSFFSGVYSPCIGFTTSFKNSKELMGLSGIFIGVGEVLGGAAFGVLGSKTIKWGCAPIVISGCVIHIICFALVFINLPNKSPFKDTSEKALITSSKEIAIFCSFLLGLGDSFFNTQVYSMLGGVYSDNSAAAFAIFKCTQSIGAAICFGYSTQLVLYGQLGILVVLALLSTITFVFVEWKVKKQATEIN